MPMNVHAGESREEFLGRCIPDMIGTGSDKRPREQAVAICNDIWRNREKDFCQDPETGLLCGSEPSGGGDTSSGGKPGGDKPSSESDADKAAAHVRTVLSAGREVAKELGYDPKLVSIGASKSPDVTFTLNGKEFKAAGIAYIREGPMQGHIKLFPEQIRSEETAKGVAAHEVEHQKFQNALNKYSEERKQVMAEPGPPPNPNGEHRWEKLGGKDAVMAADGTLRPPYDKKYPNYQAMEKAYHVPPSDTFKNADGVSDYSYDWWKAWKADTADFDQAVHETLAEMGRIKYETGKFPEHFGERRLEWRIPPGGTVDDAAPKPSQAEIDANAKIWRDLYRTVEKVYKGDA